MEENNINEIPEKQPETNDATQEEEKQTKLNSDEPIIIEKAKPKRKPKAPIEKVECIKCHKMIRKYDLKRHEMMYCNSKEAPELSDATPVKIKEEKTNKKYNNNNIEKQEHANNSPDNNELLMKLLEHINSKTKDNKQERYKNMMSKYYRN